ncbi:MAG: hypothetical protein SFW36_12905 [Leptolyngbyaceae cyanobacterium bins.59]|nr:hypothetical protein [Leptolyngbyaceae cyanobacterium bins.59]
MPDLRDREVYRREVNNNREVIREDDSANGLLIGLSLATLAALGLGAFFLFNDRPAPQQAPAQNRTVIERTREVVPVPQKAPDVNIQVPAAPAPEVNIQAPSPAPQQPATDQEAPNVTEPVPSPTLEPTTPANP